MLIVDFNDGKQWRYMLMYSNLTMILYNSVMLLIKFSQFNMSLIDVQLLPYN